MNGPRHTRRRGYTFRVFHLGLHRSESSRHVLGSEPHQIAQRVSRPPGHRACRFGSRRSAKATVRWILGIALLFFLIALGDGSPFYRLWWAVVPYVDKTRAPGIAFYIVGFAASVLAAFGTERLQRGEGTSWARVNVVAGLVVVLLAFLGVFGVMAGAYTQGTPQAAIAERATSGIMWGAVGSGIGLAVTAAIVLLFQRGVLAIRGFSLLLALVVGADLWRAGSGFWHWSRPETEQIASTMPEIEIQPRESSSTIMA